MLGSPWIAALFAIFVWWFSTGVILWAVKSADRHGGGHVWGPVLALPVLMAGIAGLIHSIDQSGTLAVYIAFLSALAIWGWIELAFLAGVITGPNRAACPDDAPPWRRFRSALNVILYHEALLIIALAGIFAISLSASNPFALWTFAVLFVARISAKLNLFLGVPRINTEFLPHPLAHIPSYFRIRKPSWLFPVSVTALTFAVGYWLERLISTGNVGFALLAALTALALLEHWLMVLPLPDDKLWRWMMPAPKKTQARNPNGL